MKPYRPANGTEGFEFAAQWCAACQCEPENMEDDEDDGCPIATAAFAFDLKEEGYPKQWVQDEDGPRCTAFIERTHPGVVDPFVVEKAKAKYDALPRDPKTGRPVI